MLYTKEFYLSVLLAVFCLSLHYRAISELK